MGKDESDLRSRVLYLLKPLHAVPVESPMTEGIPDVNCTAGWIELKHLNQFPQRDTSLVIPHHFKPAQRNWLSDRCNRGGHAWLLLRVSSTWLLCWGATAAKHLGVSWTVADLSYRALPAGVVAWPAEPSASDFIKALLHTNWRPMNK